jgi:hypothetical protein
MISMQLRLFLTTVALPAALAAQSTSFRVVPNAYADIEGTSASRAPLGWPTSRIQYLVDSGELCQNFAAITNLQLRLDGGNFNVDAPAAKTFDATITAYEVGLTPATMSPTWDQNTAGAAPTVIFQGPLNIPAAFRTYPYPNPWTVDVPLSVPFVHQRRNGNLLLDWDLANGTGENWPADAIFLHASEARGEVTRIWEDTSCRNGRGDQLSFGITVTSGRGTVGQFLTVDHTAAALPGTNVDLVYHVLGVQNQTLGGAALPIALDPLGFPGCQWNVGNLVDQVGQGPAGSITWPIPNDPMLEGLVLYTQGIGFDSMNAVAVPGQNAFQVRIGGAAPPLSGPLQMVHRGNFNGEPTGFLSPTGYYGLVMRFTGAFQ